MGQSFEYTCPTCAYRALVSGGPDRGKIRTTTTVVCLDCRELFDATTDERFAGPDGADVRRKVACDEGAVPR